MVNLIIGKESNLSSNLADKITDSVVISSRELAKDLSMLDEFKNDTVNIVFNNFQPATSLNNFENIAYYIENSIGTTAKILDYLSKNMRVNKIIYTSSSSVYGNNILCNEYDELMPLNLHASLKVSNEKLIEMYCLKNNIDFTIARIFNMYGGNDKFSIITKIIDAAKKQNDLTIINNGNALRDFIHIDDVIEIYVKLLKIKNINFINVGTGSGSSIKNILDFLQNNNIKIKTKNIEREELKISTADTQKLRKLLKKKKFLKVEDYLKKELNI